MARVSPCENGEPHHTIAFGGASPAHSYAMRTPRSACSRSAGFVLSPISVHRLMNSGKRAICASVNLSMKFFLHLVGIV